MLLEWMQVAAQTTVVIAFAGGVFSYIVLKPLNAAIEDLRNMIKEVRDDSKEHDKHERETDCRLIAVEESTKSAHHRIDGIEKRKEVVR